MDTGTHFIMGIGLAGLAQLDPMVASNPVMSTAIMAATVIGSQIPDFDALYRFRGNSVYIQKHRGASHSLPALFIYGLIITLGITLFIPTAHTLPLLYWTYIALGIHLITDLLNGYGTQALRPFSHAWISWNILNIFDPIIFFSHLVGIGLWMGGISPGPLFALIYGLLIVYVGWRIWSKLKLIDFIGSKMKLTGPLHLFPTYHPLQWNFLYYDKEHILLGEIRRSELIPLEKLPYKEEHPIIDVAKEHPDIKNFLYFSRFAYATYRETDFGYEVTWIDLRYWHKKNYPLLATLYLDHHMRPIDSYVGWLKEEKVKKKLEVSTSYRGT